MKLLQTTDYLIAVDDSKIEAGNKSLLILEGFQDGEPMILSHWQGVADGYLGKKITHHLPLNNAPVLEGVELLPPLEDEVEKLEMEYFIELEKRREVAKNFTGQVAGRHPDAFGHSEMIYMNRGYIEGYNKAKEKYKYTQEDLKKAMEIYSDWAQDVDSDTFYKTYELKMYQLIQSLQQPKLPIAFDTETKQYIYE